MPRSICRERYSWSSLNTWQGNAFQNAMTAACFLSGTCASCEVLTDQTHWIKSSPWSLIPAPEATFVFFSHSPRVTLKLARGRGHLALSGSLLPLPPSQPLGSSPASGRVWAWARLWDSLGVFLCLLATSFPSLLRDREHPWCLSGVWTPPSSVPELQGAGRGALLEAAQEEGAGTGVSSNALTLNIFLLTCSKQQHRFPGACWELSHCTPWTQPSISSAFCCRRKAQMSEAQQGWAPRGHF